MESSPCTCPSLGVEDMVYVCFAIEYFWTLSAKGTIQCRPGPIAWSRYPFGCSAETTTPYSLAWRNTNPAATEVNRMASTTAPTTSAAPPTNRRPRAALNTAKPNAPMAANQARLASPCSKAAIFIIVSPLSERPLDYTLFDRLCAYDTIAACA